MGTRGGHGGEAMTLFCLRELVFTYSTERTLKVVGQFFERRAWLNASLGHTYGRIILPTAYVTYIFLHCEELVCFVLIKRFLT